VQIAEQGLEVLSFHSAALQPAHGCCRRLCSNWWRLSTTGLHDGICSLLSSATSHSARPLPTLYSICMHTVDRQQWTVGNSFTRLCSFPSNPHSQFGCIKQKQTVSSWLLPAACATYSYPPPHLPLPHNPTTLHPTPYPRRSTLRRSRRTSSVSCCVPRRRSSAFSQCRWSLGSSWRWSMQPAALWDQRQVGCQLM
jgi:hypothetical protein